jgi:hypothetical protein
MVREIDRKRSPITRAYIRLHLLLWLSLIAGLLLLLAFGEIGLIFSLLLYVVAVVQVAKLLSKEYQRSPHDSSKFRNRVMLFAIDAVAVATLFMGGVTEVAATNYGQVYEQVGLLLIGLAGVLSFASLVWAVMDYSQNRDKFLLIGAFTFTWFSMLGALVLLLQPAEFWRGR